MGILTQDQGNNIITAINEINTDYKPKDKPKKEIKKKKDYEPKYNTGGNDGTTEANVNNNNIFVPYTSGSNLYQGE